MSADPTDPSSKVDLERRRVPLERKISLKFKEFRGFITEYSQNLSMGGMFIRTTAPKPVGTIFDFELSLTDDFKLVQGIGEVIWVRETDDGAERPSGMGVRFLDLSSESRRLIQRIVEEQVAHGGTPFELEPPGFPPPPLRQTPTAPKPKPGAQSTLFHATAAPVAPAPPLPGRTSGAPAAATAPPPARSPAAASPAAPAARAAPAPPAPAPSRAAAPAPPAPPASPSRSASPPLAAPPPLPAARTAGAALPDIDSFPDLGAPELPVPELGGGSAELLPGLDDFERQSLEGFDLVDESAELRSTPAGPATHAGRGDDVYDDTSPLRRDDAPFDDAREDVGGGIGTGAAAAGGAVAGAAAAGAASPAAPGGWPRGRGLPSGFDEVARAFSEPPAVDPQDETVRLSRLEMPPEPPRLSPLTPPRPSPPTPTSPVAPRVEPLPRPAPPAQAPARRPAPRRRSWFLPVAAVVVLLLLGGFAIAYLRFPELLPEWVRAPRLDDAAVAETAPPRRVLPRRREPAAASSPVPSSTAGALVAPVPPQAGLPPAATSPVPTAASAASGALAGTAPPGPAAGGGTAPPRPGAPDSPPRGRFSSVEEIWGQRSNLGTVITIVTNGSVPTEAFSHFRLDGGSPRQVIRLRDVDDRYRRTSVPVGTAEVKQVRLGYHTRPGGKELHIVLDLASSRVQLVRLTPVDNRLELLLSQQAQP